MDGPQPGPWNMAADEWLLDHASVPTLRLYAWEGPWLSLGYAQRSDWLDPALLDRLGVGLVRRPSGGRAVLHHREITYAMVLPQASGSLASVYSQLTGLWREALIRLGYPVQEGAESSVQGASCYQVSRPGELQLQGRKLLGSAQVRRGQRLLQHGSLPTGLDDGLFQAIFPGSRLPARLEGLSVEALLSAFPEPCQAEGWKQAELAALEGRLECTC